LEYKENLMEQNKLELPELLMEQLESGTLEDEILLNKDGNWFHNGQPFQNKKIIDLFNKSICITEDGTYVISYDKYIYPIIVEDAPVFITGVRFEGIAEFEKILLNLTTGNTEELDIDTLCYKNNTLYCRVGRGEFPAKFKRSPAFHILDRLDESRGEYFLNICGKRINIKQDI